MTRGRHPFWSSIEATKVNAKPERPIFFSHQHHGIAPWRLEGSDGATVQHLLNMLVHLIHQGRDDVLKPLLKWLVLHELDDVLCGIHASYFIRLQREDMVEFQQQCHRLPSQISGHSLRQSNLPSFCRVARRRSCLC